MDTNSDWEPSEGVGSEDTDTGSDDRRTSGSQPNFGLTAGRWGSFGMDASLGVEGNFGTDGFGSFNSSFGPGGSAGTFRSLAKVRSSSGMNSYPDAEAFSDAFRSHANFGSE